jgi:hypothetical protein
MRTTRLILAALATASLVGISAPGATASQTGPPTGPGSSRPVPAPPTWPTDPKPISQPVAARPTPTPPTWPVDPQPIAPPRTTAAYSGFDWASAALGAAVTLGAFGIALGAVAVQRGRRTPRAAQ